MKNITVLIFILMFCHFTFCIAQSENNTKSKLINLSHDELSNDTFAFKFDVPLYLIKEAWHLDSNNHNIRSGWMGFKGTRFTIITILENSIKISISHKNKEIILDSNKSSNDSTNNLVFQKGDYVINLNIDVTKIFKDKEGKDSASQIVSESRFFLLKQSYFTKDFILILSKRPQNWDISFGALTLPFKIRFKPFNFEANASLGTSILFTKKFKWNQDFSWGLDLGLSLSSVILDSSSTKGTVSTSTQRPAFTPSLSYMISYKNISFTAGLGMDLISLNSVIENSWIYKRQIWMGFGIGINLFSSNTGSSTIQPAKQTNAPKDIP